MIALATGLTDAPDGTYAGKWSAYKIRFSAVDGVRSLDGERVTITVKDGSATAEAAS